MAQKAGSSRSCLLFEGEQVPSNEGAGSGLLKSQEFRIISAIGKLFPKGWTVALHGIPGLLICPQFSP
jgi:hypothetical protein